MSTNGLWTQLVHAGEHEKPLRGLAVATAIYSTSAFFTYDTMEEVEQVFTGEGGDYIYTRHGTPTKTKSIARSSANGSTRTHLRHLPERL